MHLKAIQHKIYILQWFIYSVVIFPTRRFHARFYHVSEHLKINREQLTYLMLDGQLEAVNLL